jgi:hypothetical protein
MRAHRNGCGLDVHKKMIAACLMREDAEGNSLTEKHLFGSMTRELHELTPWLCAAQVTAVAMEATGVYWTTSASSKDSHNTSTILPIAWVRGISGNTKPTSSRNRSCRPAR